jgi:agmatinase
MNLPFDRPNHPGRIRRHSAHVGGFRRGPRRHPSVPLDRTTSYVPGTDRTSRNLVASSHMEWWDEETGTDVHGIGIATLPEMELPFPSMDDVMREIQRVASRSSPRQVPGRARRRAFDHAASGRRRGGAAPEPVGAADRRARGPARFVHGHAAQPRLRDAPDARARPVHAGGHRSLSAEEAAAAPSLRTRIFFDYNMRQDGHWIDRIVDSLTDEVYITIDCDGFDPAIMPAVGTPEPGGLSWYEGLALLRRVIEQRRVVGCDIVELCPMPGNVAPNFLCARLLYKTLAYRFGSEIRTRG